MIYTNNRRRESLTLVHTQVCSEMVVADEAMKSFSAEPQTFKDGGAVCGCLRTGPARHEGKHRLIFNLKRSSEWHSHPSLLPELSTAIETSDCIQNWELAYLEGYRPHAKFSRSEESSLIAQKSNMSSSERRSGRAEEEEDQYSVRVYTHDGGALSVLQLLQIVGQGGLEGLTYLDCSNRCTFSVLQSD